MKRLSDAERVLKHTNTIYGRLNRLVIGARASAKNKNYQFSINRDDLKELWDSQKGLCAYTQWEMSPMTGDEKLVSIDRIDSSKGYIKGNLQLTCWCVNRAKSTLGEIEFLKMCKSVAKAKAKNRPAKELLTG
jgi:hypothetical protein